MTLRQRGYLSEAKQRKIKWQGNIGKDMASSKRMASKIVNDLDARLQMMGKRVGDELVLTGVNVDKGVRLTVLQVGRGKYRASLKVGNSTEATTGDSKWIISHLMPRVVYKVQNVVQDLKKVAPVVKDKKPKLRQRYVSSGYAGEGTKDIKWKKKPGHAHKDAKYVAEKMVDFLNGAGGRNLVFRGQPLPRGGLKLIGKNGQIQIEKRGSNIIANIEVDGQKQTKKGDKEAMVGTLAIAVHKMGMK